MNSNQHDEDEQLRLAIAMSLESHAATHTAGNNTGEKTFIDLLSSDSENEVVGQSHRVVDHASQSQKPPPSIPSGILGLDRKAMEEERLARTRKRKAAISPPPISRASKTAKTTKSASPLPSQSGQKTLPPRPNNAGASNHPHGIEYPKGVVKKTWSFGFPRQDDIKLEEVLQRSTLRLAVLSSFQWDIDWLFSKIDMARSKLMLVMQAKDEETKQQYARETASMPNLRLCFPSMAGNINCMHSKLMLLSHETHLRIVVPSANLVPYDWGELGVLENSVFLIDLPRLPEQAPAQKEDDLTFFGRELLYFCGKMGLSEDIIRSLLRFDFSETKPYAFVHTIGGEHAGLEEPWRRTGYPGLGRAVTQLGLNTNSEIDVDFIASSLGSLNMDFFSMLYLAAQGDDGTTEFIWRSTTKTKANKTLIANNEKQQQALHQIIEQKLRVFFPSRETILRSKGGVQAAGPICFQRRWWENPKFPRKLLRDCKSTRQGLLMHNKVLYVRPQPSAVTVKEDTPLSDASTIDPDEPQPEPTTKSVLHLQPWAYIGSANCSESAWGRLVLERTTKKPKLSCRNWECGVIVPVPRKEASAGEGGSIDNLTAFVGAVPVPIEWPGEMMEGKTPWFFTADEGA